MTNVSVVIPIKNEAENIRLLIDKIGVSVIHD